jgi:Uma2 family endonuclease
MTHYEESREAAKNPVLIVEVLSENTESYDRGEKFKTYRQIVSFVEYVLIEQRFAMVEVFSKIEDNNWQYRFYDNLEQMVQFNSISAQIPMSEIYEGVIFEAIPDN